MMSLIVFGIAFVGFYFWVARPVATYYHNQEREEYLRNLRYLKLKTVRRYYPALAGLSFDEIEEAYNVEDAWQRIGQDHIRREA